MKSTITTPAFSTYVIERLQNDLSNPLISNAYITLGRSTAFGNTPDSIEKVVYTTNKVNEFLHHMVGMKKIFDSDMHIVIPRVDWTSNVMYDPYEDHIEIYSFEDYHDLGTVNANSNTTLTGTFNISSSNIVTADNGEAANLSRFVFPGDLISVNSEIKSVSAIHPNGDFLVVNSAFSNTNSSPTLTIIQNSYTIIANSANFLGNLEHGNVVVVGQDVREVVAIKGNKVISLNAALTYSNANVTLLRRDNTFPQVANTFYVRNNRDQVFKCLFNGNNAPSTVEPTIDIDGQLPENPFILTSDGYKWKYMYTIPPGLKQKFFTNQWMPVVSDDAVTSTAINGRLDIVNVLWGGSGYFAGGNSNNETFLTVANTDGSGAKLLARVANGNITSVTVQIGGNNYTRGEVTANDSNRLPPSTLLGTVNIDGSTIVVANTANTSNQSFVGNVYVNDIITINGASRNVVSVINSTHLQVNVPFYNAANTQVATVVPSDAKFDIQIGPPGGHGSNPVRELRAHSLMVCVEFEDTENESIPMSDSTNLFDYNQIGILVNPLIANSAWYANLTNYRASTRLYVSDPGEGGNFINDETIEFVANSAVVATANVAHWSAGDSYLYINNITGTISANQTVRGLSSGITTAINTIANSEVKLFTGDLIYMENRTNIVRKDNQIDQVKIVLSF